jgi:hypothetical protein
MDTLVVLLLVLPLYALAFHVYQQTCKAKSSFTSTAYKYAAIFAAGFGLGGAISSIDIDTADDDIQCQITTMIRNQLNRSLSPAPSASSSASASALSDAGGCEGVSSSTNSPQRTTGSANIPQRTDNPNSGTREPSIESFGSLINTIIGSVDKQ